MYHTTDDNPYSKFTKLSLCTFVMHCMGCKRLASLLTGWMGIVWWCRFTMKVPYSQRHLRAARMFQLSPQSNGRTVELEEDPQDCSRGVNDRIIDLVAKATCRRVPLDCVIITVVIIRIYHGRRVMNKQWDLLGTCAHHLLARISGRAGQSIPPNHQHIHSTGQARWMQVAVPRILGHVGQPTLPSIAPTTCRRTPRVACLADPPS